MWKLYLSSAPFLFQLFLPDPHQSPGGWLHEEWGV